MNEKLMRRICQFIGTIAFLLYAIFVSYGDSKLMFTVRISMAVIALIAFSIRCGIEIVTEEGKVLSCSMICFAVFDIIFSVATTI